MKPRPKRFGSARRPAPSALLAASCVLLYTLYTAAAAHGQGADAPPVEIAPAGAVAEFEATRENQRQATDRALAGMPAVDVRHIGEVLQVRVEGGNFVIRTPLPTTSTPGYQKAKVAEIPVPLMIRVIRAPADRTTATQPVVPTELTLQLVDYSRPRRITNLSVDQRGTAMLTFVHQEQTPLGSRSVQLMVARGPAYPGGGNVQLIVNEASPRPGASPESVNLTLPDCAAFIRHYPEVTDKYIRPMLALLGQEAVFAPDPLLAAQVFPDSRRPDNAARAEVERLLPDLAAADYRRRDRATAALKAMGPRAAAVLLELDRAALTPEQRMRVDQVLAPLGFTASAPIRQLRRDPDFLLNCLYSEDPATRRAAAAALKELVGKDASLDAFDPDAPPEARTAAIRELRAKILTPADRRL